MSASSPQATTTWRLDGAVARLDHGSLRAVVDVTAPNRGLHELVFRDKPLEGWLLGVDVDARPDDAYARGRDLVATYRETPARPFTIQVYWSAWADSQGVGEAVLDVTVSIQTRQWEAYPRVLAASMLASCELTAVDAGAILWRLPEADWTYAECSPPGDLALRETAPEPNGAHASDWVFSDQFMERGVIRRLRVRGAFLPRQADRAAVVALRDALATERPPLTA
jgi:hypothetical protein